MKKLVLFVIISFSCILSFAQAPKWQWVSTPNSIGIAYSVVADGSGNSYVTGYFNSPTFVFGTDTLKNIGGSENLFLAKYSPNGIVLWAKNAEVNFWNVTHQGSMSPVAVDNTGNVYVAGGYEGTAIFSPDTLPSNDSTSQTFNIFLTKYDSNGNVIWAKSFGKKDYWDLAMAVAADANGNVLLTGLFTADTLNFGSVFLTNGTPGIGDIFLTKFDTNGNVLWARSAGGTDDDEAWSVAVDGSGNSFITGIFDSHTMTFGSTTLTNAGDDAVFIAKYDANGNVLWAKSAGTGGDDGYSVAVDASGNAYLGGGFFSPTITFGSITLTNTSGGSANIFLAKYDVNGNVLWAKSSGGNSDDRALSVAVDASGNAYATGYFDSPSITFGSFHLTNAIPDYENTFLVKYNNSGNVLWAKSLGGINAGDICNGNSVAVTNNSGDVYVAGYFDSGALAFDTISVIDTLGSSKMFLAKLSGSCLSYFYLYPDTATPHNYYAVNMSTGVPPISYFWDWGDGTHDTIAYPTHTYSAAGYYTICLTTTDYTGCVNMYCDSSNLQKNTNTMITVNVISQSSVGIHENSVNDFLSVFPNPATDNLQIQTALQIKNIEITDITGRLLYTTNAKTFNCSSFAKGVYFIRATTEKGVVIKKFIKE